MQGPFISLLSDYGFKATFGNERDSLFLRRALQALIQSDTPIAEVTFLPNELVRLNPDSRGGVYDLACTDELGRYFIVEMQLSNYPEFLQRMKFYSLYRFNTLVLRGDYSFKNLPRIYCIGILGTTIFPEISAYHNTAVLRNEAGELMDDQTVFITVELPKFVKPAAAIITDLDKLLYTMKTLHQAPEDQTKWPEFWTEEWIRTAMQELDWRSMDPEELLLYQMTMTKNAHAVQVVKKQVEKAEQEARQIGLEEGMQEGMQQGMQEGMQQAATATVRNLLAMNLLTTAQIAAAANVTPAFVEGVRAAGAGSA
ncbi:Rpn family recombination-promoting nuclease/putative transposase [uncultured Hymenobacter sp.]|uniref:Rpn family recombination-promoting nuclease/putative transposase n=1 Tax=uncultured Hymenobacter sp. TaxID=170016 RepID=UPI0035CBAF72